MDASSEASEPECYLYVNIQPSKTRESSRKEIVPSTCVKTFKYDEYKKNNNIYKTKLLKIKVHSDGKKEKYYVLYADTDYNKVMQISNQKRFAQFPPEHCETLSGDSTVTVPSVEEQAGEDITEENSEEDPLADVENETEEANKEKIEMLRQAKLKRKKMREINKQNLKDNDEMILDNYLENLSDNDSEFDGLQPATSTPLHKRKKNASESNKSDNDTIRQQEIRIKQLENQLKKCRRQMVDINKDYEERLYQNDNRNTANTSKTECCSGIDHFKMHDKMFAFSKEQAEQELEYDEHGNVHLGSQVYCNAVSFNDAFKSKRPFNCLCLLSEGVYGLKELSQRCVRHQANTRNKKVLSPTKRYVIERKVYAFMRIKDYTLTQIDDFLDNLNAHHRKVINGAISRVAYLEKAKQKEKKIDEQLNQLNEE